MKLNELKANKHTKKPKPLYELERKNNFTPLLVFITKKQIEEAML